MKTIRQLHEEEQREAAIARNRTNWQGPIADSRSGGKWLVVICLVEVGVCIGLIIGKLFK